jgi:aspartyl aminopeptidase
MTWYSLFYRERNRLLAKETRKRNKQQRENLSKEAELLRYQNKMLVQSIKEVLDVVDLDVDQSNPTVVAIKDIVYGSKKRDDSSIGFKDSEAILRIISKKEGKDNGMSKNSNGNRRAGS